MRYRKLLSKYFLLCAVLLMPACSDDDYINSVKDGDFFARGNTVRFYYLDEEGNDLINPTDVTTLPVSYYETEELPTEVIVPDDYKEGFYNRNWNTVTFDQGEGLYYMSGSVPGDSRKSTYTYYVGYKDEFDKMEIVYNYSTKEVDGGRYYANIVSWKLNGTNIYSDSKDGFDKKVFITKSGGKTTISFKR